MISVHKDMISNDIMMKLVNGIDYQQEFFVYGGVILLSFHQIFVYIVYGIMIFVIILLSQQSQYWNYQRYLYGYEMETFNQVSLAQVQPSSSLLLYKRPLHNQFSIQIQYIYEVGKIEGCNVAKILDEPSIIAYMTKKTYHISFILQSREMLDHLNLFPVHFDSLI